MAKTLDMTSGIMEELLLCSLCTNNCQNPKTLPCQHTFCQQCLDLLPLKSDHKGSLLVCPSCEKLAEIPNNLIENLPTSRLLVCLVHSKLLQSYCLSCEILICEECSQQTHKQHTSRSLVEKNMPKSWNMDSEAVKVCHEKVNHYKFHKAIEGMKYPWGITVHDNGTMAVAEWGNNCITILDEDGAPMMYFGANKSDSDMLQNPCGVIFTSDDHLLVTDDSRLLKYTLDGSIITSVGGKGNDILQFNAAAGLGIHPMNNKIYIADANNHRIQVLNPDFTFSHTFGHKGKEHGNFYFPWDIAFDSKGLVYVAEGTSRIQCFTSEGKFVDVFGKKGSKPGLLDRPSAIAIDKDDRIFITDLYNNRLSIFDTSGESICCLGNKGYDIGEFSGPCGLAVDHNGVIYVADGWNNRIQLFKTMTS